jgi:hypothetical protein
MTSMGMNLLSPAAAQAVAYVKARSLGPPVDPTLRISVHFHPDRLYRAKPLLHVLADEGVLRTQFETGTSNGGLTAHVGGDRWRWESRIFGAAYDSADPAERPKYGALNFRKRRFGGSVRFGSAHFRLTADALQRATFCYPDSVFEPRDFGVAARMALIDLARAHQGDALDDYIEAQVHGPVRLAEDVEALVLDPCFKDTDTEASARNLPCPVEWHHGFEARTEDILANADYRGHEYAALCAKLAKDGKLDAAIIGNASRSGNFDEQGLKRAWHCIARFGSRESWAQDGLG